MIFGSIIHRAEAAIGNVVEQAVARVLVALPLLAAAGFATAAGSSYLTARYGQETSHLIVAGIFLAIGLVAAAFVASRTPAATPAADGAAQPAPAETGQEPAAAPLTPAEKDLLSSLAAAAAPIAMPGLVRLLLRNIPLLVIGLVVAYILTRQTSGETAMGESRSG